MPSWSVDFDAPQYLLLLLLLPVFWFIGRGSLQALGSWRQSAALALRLAVASLIIITLAEPNWLTLIHRLTVLFVVDASDSIEPSELAHAIDYVNSAAKQRNKERGDRAGVVVFGRAASVEVPPLAHDWKLAKVESDLDPRFTNLESALKLAKATFAADTAKRLVIISDGNENAGQALPQAAELLESGVGIDSVPISYERKGDVRVEKIAVPTDVRRGTPFQLRVVLNNLAERRTIPGKLRITRSLGGTEQIVTEEALQLAPGKKVVTLPQELTESGISTYAARFVPDRAADDAHSENNVATGFCRIGGQGHVLLIEDASLAGRFDEYVHLLRRNEIEVTVRDTRRPFDDLADLQQFDCVILGDVARVAGEPPSEITQFTDSQIHALVQNTEHFGAGLIVLGGPNSYGAGGWTNTELEKTLPVDFQIKNAKVNAVGALVLVIDSSGSMSGEKIQWSKAAAVAAAQMLGKRDFLGVVTFDSEAHWIVPLRRNDESLNAKSRIDRLGAAGGTDMMPALAQAYRAIQGVDASLKHVIVLTDGHTPKDNFESLVSGMAQKGITTTGVAVGPDADRNLLSDIGRRGGGKFYQVLSPKAIPRIFMREARRVAMPLVFEDPNGIAVQNIEAGELLSGINGPLPATFGYVLTTVKEDPLVEVLLATPRKPAPNATILATWQYGLGRAAALTTDVGQRWATDWPAWGNYEKLMLQLVRWSMRPHDMDERLTLTAEAREDSIDVVVSALDPDDDRSNYLNLMGTAILPNGVSQEFSIRQIAPGRYTAQVPAQEPGNYFLSIVGGSRSAPLRAAVSIAPTAELDDLYSYDGFLTQLAEGTPKGGERGRVIQSPRGIADTAGLLKTDVFRPGIAPAKARDSMWPVVLLLASVAFFGDVFCRRVVVTFDWLPRAVNWLRRRGAAATVVEAPRMERLRQSKASAMARYSLSPEEVRRGSDRGAFGDELAPTTSVAAEPSAIAAQQPMGKSTTEALPADVEISPTEFTSRLLEAKKRVRDEHQRPQ